MAMKLESKDCVDAPASLVYPLVRDHLPDLVPYLTNIEKVEVLERQEEGPGKVFILNMWKAQMDIPSALQRILKPEFLSWRDYAHWQDECFHVDYRLEGTWLRELYTATGCNSFKPANDGKGTEITISCEVELHPDKVPGVPTFIVKALLPALETLIRRLLAPNLTALSAGVRGYLAAHPDFVKPLNG